MASLTNAKRAFDKGACPLVRDRKQDRILELKEQIALMDEEPLRL